jgi:hypothetical protein
VHRLGREQGQDRGADVATSGAATPGPPAAPAVASCRPAAEAAGALRAAGAEARATRATRAAEAGATGAEAAARVVLTVAAGTAAERAASFEVGMLHDVPPEVSMTLTIHR